MMLLFLPTGVCVHNHIPLDICYTLKILKIVALLLFSDVHGKEKIKYRKKKKYEGLNRGGHVSYILCVCILF